MSRPKKWDEMVKSSKAQIEDFRDFADDNAVVWADNEMRNYKRAMMILVNSNNNYNMSLGEEDSKFVQTMIRRATE